MARAVLEVASVSKRFCRDLRQSLNYGAKDILSELMPWRARPSGLRSDEFWALDDVSFTLERGEAMAIVGHNGAGKSTLLRVTAGLFRPDMGEVCINGRVQSVIELGSGFNALLSGRENAKLILSWQCGDDRSVATAIEAVNAFAELGKLFDAPLQAYSSGMRARLAFALALSIPSDLLLLDEVLAVGDQGFQRKCLRQIRDYLEAGGSLLFVSHNIFQIQAVCRRGLLLEKGRVAFSGSAADAIDRLFESDTESASSVQVAASGPARARLDCVTVVGSDGGGVRTGGDAEFKLEYFVAEPLEAACAISVWTRDLSVCIAIFIEPRSSVLPAGHGQRSCLVSALPLVAGNYLLRAAMFDPNTMHSHARHGYTNPATAVKVFGDTDRLTLLRRDQGQLVLIEGEWRGGA
jgi:lipopolysaccharide transport system ATP-binding protein